MEMVLSGTMGKHLKKFQSKDSAQFKLFMKLLKIKQVMLWFGTSTGLIKYDGEKFTTYSEKDGLQDEEIWGLTIDKSGLIWVGSMAGLVILMVKNLHLFSCLKQRSKIQNLCFLINWFLNFWKTKMERCGLLPMEMEFSNTRTANSFI
jgi:ligand-binding sensor domain-containing protein